MEKLSAIFMAVGGSAPRYHQMALLYPHSRTLQSNLSEYFIVVVRLCHQVLKYAQKSALRQLTSSALGDSEITSHQSQLERWARAIKEEVNMLVVRTIKEESQENYRWRALSSKRAQSESLRRKLKNKLRVLDACSMYDHETTWKQLRKAGNTILLNENAEYKDWKEQTESCTLVYTGILGSGKSVLMANMVEDLFCYQDSKEGQQNVTVAYFFCRHDIHESLTARTIIGSLARQLLRQVPNLTTPAENLDPTSSSGLDSNQLLRLLQDVLPAKSKAYFILDGLDECGVAERNMLLGFLHDLQKTSVLLPCVSFRSEPDSSLKLDSTQVTAARFATIPDPNPDIEAFIEAELERCATSRALTVGDPAIILEIQDALKAGSQGMFLWVVLQITSLCSMKTDRAIRQALENLPKGLSETFSRVLQKSETLGKHYQRLILELVLVAFRPLTTKELQEALSVVPGDTDWSSDQLINDIYSTLACCGSLIVVDEEESTVRLVHQSVKQFLLVGDDIGGGESEGSIINGGKIAIDNARKNMAEIVLTYLNFKVFEGQLSTLAAPRIAAEPIPSKIIHSTIGSSNKIASYALELFKSRRQPYHDVGKTLAGIGRFSKPYEADVFYFHAYANLYWLKHSICISEKVPLICDLLLPLLRKKPADVDGQNLLWWSARNGHEKIFKLLLETSKVDLNSRDEYGQTSLLLAARYGYETIVKLALETGKVDVNSKDKHGWTPFFFAACSGYETIVKLLLETGKVDVDSKYENGQTPLSWAARREYKTIVKLLLETGKVDVNSKDKHGWTPFFFAACSGYETIVKLLLETGKVDVDSKDKYGRTPLRWAKASGHQNIVELVQDWQGGRKSKDEDGQILLGRAGYSRRKAIVNDLKMA